MSRPALLSIDAALELITAEARPLGAEQVPLADAYGRFLAEPVRAAIDLPPFRNSAMDGYAVRAADTPGRLRVAGESAAGAPFAGALAIGDAVVISTGAVVPASADAVVPIEDVTVTGDVVDVAAAVSHGAFIREAGGDVKRGDELLTAGTRIGPAQIGALAAAGIGQAPCRRRPRVAVLATGSELREPGEPLAPGEIFDANGPMLGAALRSCGALVEQIPTASDTLEAHRTALGLALEHDVVISSGGVSVGAHDLVREVGRELGVREVFWRVAMRPGKPLAFGVRDATLVFGLPGNPVSTLVCFELFVRPALLALQGGREPNPAFSAGALAAPVQQNSERDDLIRVRVVRSGGDAVLEPLRDQQSHQIAIAAGADALARIPAGAGELPAGSSVFYLPIHY